MRLKQLRPKVAKLAPRLSPRIDSHGHRTTDEWRRWYGLQRWKDLRWQVLVEDNFTCRCGCGVLELNSSNLTADHITPHRGDPVLFWDRKNLQTLRISPCHNQAKQRAERAARTQGGA